MKAFSHLMSQLLTTFRDAHHQGLVVTAEEAQALIDIFAAVWVVKATVYHVTVREPLDVGRLKRNAFSFLCTAASGNDGKDWSGCGADPVHHYDGNGQPYTPKPTCKACLKLLERFKRDE